MNKGAFYSIEKFNCVSARRSVCDFYFQRLHSFILTLCTQILLSESWFKYYKNVLNRMSTKIKIPSLLGLTSRAWEEYERGGRKPSDYVHHIHFTHRCRQYGIIPNSLLQPQRPSGPEQLLNGQQFISPPTSQLWKISPLFCTPSDIIPVGWIMSIYAAEFKYEICCDRSCWCWMISWLMWVFL